MQEPEPEKNWYLPHHPVVNPNKPGKMHRIAIAAAKYIGQSWSSNLITGLDLLNNLVGIVLRFRENPFVLLSDIEGLCMQIAIRHAIKLHSASSGALKRCLTNPMINFWGNHFYMDNWTIEETIEPITRLKINCIKVAFARENLCQTNMKL